MFKKGMILLAEDGGEGGGSPEDGVRDQQNEITLPEDAPKYLAQASREQKENKDIIEWSKSYEKFPDLLNAAYQSQTKLKSITPVPGKDASDEEISVYLKAIGVPDDADGYDIKGNLEEEDLSEIKKLAHDNTLTQKQAQAVAKAYENLKSGQKANADEEMKKANAAAYKELTKEWGEADFDKNMEILGRAARLYFAVDEDSLLNGPLGSDPQILKGIYRAGRDLLDTPLGPGRSSQKEKEKGKTPEYFEYPE